MATETDYLVIGAGATGLAFVDEMLDADPDAEIVMVDRRHAPGGHWNDAYPFVRLHQPSVFYGVGSTPLGSSEIDTAGTNKGFMHLAEGSMVLDYFHRVANERFKKSGRVRFIPMSEYREGEGVFSLLNGEPIDIDVRRKIVNASYYTNAIPKTHTPKFKIAEDVACVPVNDLPARAANADHIVVLGAGKTAIDACVWLMENGMPPDKVSWVRPRDPWLWNRATTQPSMEYFDTVFNAFADRQQAIAEATSADDFARRMEAAGIWLRLDKDVWPTFFHAATVSGGEVEAVNRIKNVVRMGRVTALAPGKMILEKGERAMPENTLYVDCTASAVEKRPVVPVFDSDRITLQMIRFPGPTYSGAFIAKAETLFESDEEKNLYTAPTPMPDTVGEYLKTFPPEFSNRFHASKHPVLRKWNLESRLDGFTALGASAPADDAEKQAILERIKTTAFAAAENLPELIATV